MLLLPLAENAVTHGVRAGHAGAVSLSIEVRPREVVIALENPGRYRGPRPERHGLKAFRLRLRAAYGERASFTIQSCADGTRTVATVRFEHPLTPS